MADSFALHTVPAQLLHQVNSRVYKCAGTKGTPVYQDSPCVEGALLRDFTANPANVSILPTGRRMPLHADDPREPAEPSGKRPKKPPAEHRTVDAKSRANRNTKSSAESNAKSNPNSDANSNTNQRANERRNLRVGMTEGEILARVGKPDLKGAGEARKASARWTYLPATGDPQTVTTVALEKGKVIAVDRTVAR